jgi:hypothetical protein
MGGFTFAMAAVSAIRDTYELANAALGLKESTKRDLALSEVLPKLLEAQRAANEAVQEEAALFQRIRELEEENRQLKAQRSQLEDYERKRFFPGSVAYVRKGTLNSGEDPEYACATCYEDRQKIISLQPTGQIGRRRHMLHRCPSCASTVELGPEMTGNDPGPEPAPTIPTLKYSKKGIV